MQKPNAHEIQHTFFALGHNIAVTVDEGSNYIDQAIWSGYMQRPTIQYKWNNTKKVNG